MPKPKDPAPLFVWLEKEDKAAAKAQAKAETLTLAQWIAKLIRRATKRK